MNYISPKPQILQTYLPVQTSLPLSLLPSSFQPLPPFIPLHPPPPQHHKHKPRHRRTHPALHQPHRPPAKPILQSPRHPRPDQRPRRKRAVEQCIRLRCRCHCTTTPTPGPTSTDIDAHSISVHFGHERGHGEGLGKAEDGEEGGEEDLVGGGVLGDEPEEDVGRGSEDEAGCGDEAGGVFVC